MFSGALISSRLKYTLSLTGESVGGGAGVRRCFIVILIRKCGMNPNNYQNVMPLLSRYSFADAPFQILLVFYFSTGPRTSSHSPILIHSSFFNYVSSEKVAFQAIGFSKCRDQGSVFVQVNGEMFPGTFDVLGDNCPTTYAPTCTWNAYRINAEIPLEKIPLSVLDTTREVRLFTPTSSATVSITAVNTAPRPEGLEACVAPLFWYNYWVRVIEFIELYRSQGVSHFYIYVASVSELVDKVLLRYQAEGLVTIVNWPDLPKSESSNPNLGVYRLGLDSCHMDCLLRSKKKFVAQVDFDDYIFVRGKTLLDYVTEHENAHTEIGSFSFVRETLLKQPVHGSLQDISSVSFEEFHKASVCDVCDYNKKVIVVPDKVDILMTHKVKVFRNNKSTEFKTFEIPMDVGAAYHARYALSAAQQKAKYQKVNLFSSRVIASLTEKFTEIAGELANTTAKLDITPTIDLLEKCTQNWMFTPSQCKAPHEYCWSELINVEEWKFANDRVGRQEQYVAL
uniref:Glycosyltransferase family 92 protein n=1 Tax=Steinernema glaseri TaxID=37863 RepID=A0A1I7YNL6_9BILA